MSAQRLRAAAAAMRARAEAATDGPWETRPARRIRRLMAVAFRAPIGAFASEADARHCMAWHPDAALAVADLLDAVAEQLPDPVSRRSDPDTNDAALAVADAYLPPDP